MTYAPKTGLKTVTNRNKGARKTLIIKGLTNTNRNKKCYGNRNKKCYDLKSVTICKSNSYKGVCYDLLRLKQGLNPMNINELWVNRNKKTVTKIFILKSGEVVTYLTPLLKGKGRGDVYQPLGNERYKNITTGNTGIIEDKVARNHLVIPERLNKMMQKNAALYGLIEGLGLAIQ